MCFCSANIFISTVHQPPGQMQNLPWCAGRPNHHSNENKRGSLRRPICSGVTRGLSHGEQSLAEGSPLAKTQKKVKKC